MSIAFVSSGTSNSGITWLIDLCSTTPRRKCDSCVIVWVIQWIIWLWYYRKRTNHFMVERVSKKKQCLWPITFDKTHPRTGTKNNGDAFRNLLNVLGVSIRLFIIIILWLTFLKKFQDKNRMPVIWKKLAGNWRKLCLCGLCLNSPYFGLSYHSILQVKCPYMYLNLKAITDNNSRFY